MNTNSNETPFVELSADEAAAIGGGMSASCFAAGAGVVGGLFTGQFEVALFCGWYMSHYCPG